MTVLEKLGVKANMFGSAVLRKVRQLGVKLPKQPTKTGALDSQLPGTDDVIVLEAMSKGEGKDSQESVVDFGGASHE